MDLFVIIVFSVFCNICQCHMRKEPGSKVIPTRYGNVQGVRVSFPPRARLRAIEAFYGMEYGTTHNYSLRFMPASGPLERWPGDRIALQYRSVCPQPVMNERKLVSQFPKAKVEHIIKLAPYLSHQREDCLMLNLYIPTRSSGRKGRWCYLKMNINKLMIVYICLTFCSTFAKPRWIFIKLNSISWPPSDSIVCTAWYTVKIRNENRTTK